MRDVRVAVQIYYVPSLCRCPLQSNLFVGVTIVSENGFGSLPEFVA
jgi:hypothetical protein